MASFDVWRTENEAEWADGQHDPSFIIGRNEISLVVSRVVSGVDTDQAAQTCAIFPASRQYSTRVMEGKSGAQISDNDVIVVGDSSFDIQAGDIFVYQTIHYKVSYVDYTMPTKVEALAKAVQ